MCVCPDESLVLSRDLEVQLEVRPASVSGLLLHAGGRTEQHLSLFLHQGEVTASLNAGNGLFSTSFTPEETLCDGRWHTITGETRRPGHRAGTGCSTLSSPRA